MACSRVWPSHSTAPAEPNRWTILRKQQQQQEQLLLQERHGSQGRHAPVWWRRPPPRTQPDLINHLEAILVGASAAFGRRPS
jgi:hypothetical protein